MAFQTVGGNFIVKKQIEAGVPAHTKKRDGADRTEIDWNLLEGDCLKRGVSLTEVVARFLAIDGEAKEADVMAEIALKGEQAKMAAKLLDKVIPPLKPRDDAKKTKSAVFTIKK